jgi:hypothetical protein
MRSLRPLAVFLIVACANPSHPGEPGAVNQGVQVQPNRQFDISVGQEVQVQGTSISVRFNGVSEDSRCAVDVQCVWAGNAVVRIRLSSAGRPTVEASLNTTLDPKSTTFEGHSVILRGLKPEPRSGTNIPSTSYVASLEVAR